MQFKWFCENGGEGNENVLLFYILSVLYRSAHPCAGVISTHTQRM